jgi:hypothetical protein
MTGLRSDMLIHALLAPVERCFTAALVDLGLEAAGGEDVVGDEDTAGGEDAAWGQAAPDQGSATDTPGAPARVSGRSSYHARASHQESSQASGQAARPMPAVQGRTAPDTGHVKDARERATAAAGPASPGTSSARRVPRLIPLSPAPAAPAAASSPAPDTPRATTDRAAPKPGHSSDQGSGQERPGRDRPASSVDGPDIAALLARRLEPPARPASPDDSDAQHASATETADPDALATPARATPGSAGAAGRPRLRLRPVPRRGALPVPGDESAATGATTAVASPAFPARMSDTATIPAARPVPAVPPGAHASPAAPLASLASAPAAAPAASRASAASHPGHALAPPPPPGRHAAEPGTRAASPLLQIASALAQSTGVTMPRSGAVPALRTDSGEARPAAGSTAPPVAARASSAGSAPGTAAPAPRATSARRERPRLRVQPRPGSIAAGHAPAVALRSEPRAARPAPGSLVPAIPSTRPPLLASGSVDVTPPDGHTWSPDEAQAAQVPAMVLASGLPAPALVLPVSVTPASPSTGPALMAPAGITTTRPTSFPAHLRVRASVRPGRTEAVTTAAPATAAPAVEALPADPMDPRLERAMTEVLRRAARRQGIDV